MKHLLFLLFAAFSVSTVSAGEKNTKEESKEIKWMNLDEVQVAMKKEPRKVLIDVYTGWCGWCKRMDATTYQNADVVKYINKNFYAVKLDAERKDTLRFVGKMYWFAPENKANTVAVELLHGQMSYPSTVFMEKGFQMITNVPGYHGVSEWETILKYLGEDIYKQTKWEEFQKAYKPLWVDNTPAPAAMPGH